MQYPYGSEKYHTRDGMIGRTLTHMNTLRRTFSVHISQFEIVNTMFVINCVVGRHLWKNAPEQDLVFSANTSFKLVNTNTKIHISIGP